MQSLPVSFFRRILRLAGLVVAGAVPLCSHGAPGDVDTAFDPQVNSHPFGIAIQPAGPINLVGWFSRIGGASRAGLGQVFPDGSLNTGFSPASNDQVFCTAIQADGRILIAGEFTEIDKVFRGRIARLNADGSLDSSFQTHADIAVYSMSVLADGKILITGNFNRINGVQRWKVARLHADGTLDTSFPDPRINAQVWTHTVQPDGKILIGGAFDTVNGNPQTRLARLNPDGSHDPSFINPNMGGSIHGIVRQPDGKVVIGGTFTQVNGVTRNRLARLSGNGVLDTSFAPSLDNTLMSMMPQADGKLIITGNFTRVNGAVRVYTARLHADGALDNTFISNGTFAGETVLSSALQADGKLLVGGNFSELNGFRRPTFARLLNDPATQALTVPTGDRVEWRRGGSSPELQRVWFDLSTNNGLSWTPLASGTSIAGGWEAGGLTLAGDGMVRARGYAPAGRFNGSSSLMETKVSFSFPPPEATTLAATAITGVGAQVNGEINANGTSTSVVFEYGLTDTYGQTATAAPAMIGGNEPTPVAATLSGLLPETRYHYRVSATNPSGTTKGAGMVFTTLSNNAKLAALSLNEGSLVPGFQKLTTRYIATVPFATDRVTVTPATDHPRATARVGGVAVPGGSSGGTADLAVGNNAIDTVVTAEDGVTTGIYSITVTRLPQEFVFNSPADVPVSAGGFSTGGHPAFPVLNYHPLPGTLLTMVDNTSLEFIQGRFSNLSQGQLVTLSHGGIAYEFVADYFGGSGNDLVLRWARNAAFAWGANGYGQLGRDTGRVPSPVPVPVDAEGVLAGKTLLAVSSGYLHGLALCSDGTLASWGYNVHGQLGDGSTENRNLPVAVATSGALAGKTVVAIASGPFHNLALCSDGTAVAWGNNLHGQLGDGTKSASSVPVAVAMTGALAGKTLVAVAAGSYHSFALCSDGTLAAWGYNDEGELGDGTTLSTLTPVAVKGVLTGRTVQSISAGQYHALALCTDGTVAAWGYNHRGQLGNGTTQASAVPVEVQPPGVLAGKSVTAVRAGGDHSLALCSDGTVAAWGWNGSGQLGDGSATSRLSPVAIDQGGVLAGKSVVSLGAGAEHSLALCADGTLATWGSNRDGRLGSGSPATVSHTPVLVGPPAAGGRHVGAPGGASGAQGFAVVAMPAPSSSGSVSAGERVLTVEQWQSLHFGDDAASEKASDLSDPDGDGLANLVEYGFGLNPMVADAAMHPRWRRDGEFLILEFTEPEGIAEVNYAASFTLDLTGDIWLPVPDEGSAPVHRFRVPIDQPRKFMRVEVNRR
jgi:uncharacterized delta-60 repeat protein